MVREENQKVNIMAFEDGIKTSFQMKKMESKKSRTVNSSLVK